MDKLDLLLIFGLFWFFFILLILLHGLYQFIWLPPTLAPPHPLPPSPPPLLPSPPLSIQIPVWDETVVAPDVQARRIMSPVSYTTLSSSASSSSSSVQAVTHNLSFGLHLEVRQQIPEPGGPPPRHVSFVDSPSEMEGTAR